MKWHQIRVGDFGTVITGNTPPKNNLEYYGCEYKFIKPTDMEVGMRYTPFTEECYSQLAHEKYKKSLIPPLSTCVVTIGSIGKKITLTDDYCFVNQAVNAVVPDTANFDPYFVFYALKNILHRVKAADTGASSGRENVSKSNFSNLTLSVPVDKIDQQKIASILSGYDDLLENNTKRIKLLEEASQNIYKEWFVNFRFPGYENAKFENGLPKGWNVVPLADVIDYKEGPGLRNWQYRNDGIPFLNIRVLNGGEIDFTDINYLEESEVEAKYKHFLLDEFDHVISTSGTLGKVVTIRKSHLPLCLNTSIIRMRQKSERYGKWLIREMIRSDNFLNEMRSMATGSAQLNFGPKHLEMMNVVVPELEKSRLFENIIDPFQLKLLLLLDKNKLLKEARDILLPRLMNGTITVDAAVEEFEAAY
ncbi:restriction endonuclease subunit S [Polluticoccus soli]|uniref:restriction endonuclease subunit S n=1 Tax=Polluticoccus soli TaxID=3034150 RepID=UPI0023E14E4E|nr:restriction endonuclease subunit S [Flavipsychrobacter sp. JY13-12]